MLKVMVMVKPLVVVVVDNNNNVHDFSLVDRRSKQKKPELFEWNSIDVNERKEMLLMNSMKMNLLQLNWMMTHEDDFVSHVSNVVDDLQTKIDIVER